MEKRSVFCVLNTILGTKLCTIIHKTTSSTTPCHLRLYTILMLSGMKFELANNFARAYNVEGQSSFVKEIFA